AGLEYVFWPGGKGGRRLSLWGGYYRTPDDRIRMSQFNSDDSTVNEAYLRAFKGGSPADHVTGGIGLEIGQSSIHLSGDGWNEGLQVIGTYTYRFGTNR